MTYSPTAFQFTHLLQAVYDDLEQTKGLLATGGSTTTVVDTSLSDGYQDDSFNGYTAFVTRDSAGAGAAPEGEYKAVSDYVASTFTLTTAAFTIAVAAGDSITLARGSQYPLQDAIRLCNLALQKLGVISLPDTSLTSAASQTEYDLPVALKRDDLINVMYNLGSDTDDNRWQEIEYDVQPAAPGTAGKLVIPQIPSGKTIRILYNGRHPTVNSYDDPISEYIHPGLAIAACSLEVARWKRSASQELMPKLEGNYQEMYSRFPVYKTKRRPRTLPQWSVVGRYPGDQSIYDR